MKPAVLIIDLLEDYFADGHLAKIRHFLVEETNRLVQFARCQQFPVVWVRQEFEPDLSDAFLVMRKARIKKTIKGTFGAKLLHELDRHPRDYEIVKKRYSAFFQTELDDLLKRLDVHGLILAGINSHACVRVAAVDGYQRDYEVFLVKECTASPDQEHHRVSLDYLHGEISQVVTLPELISLFQGPLRS
jgi:nicotinamidase-related amidase